MISVSKKNSSSQDLIADSIKREDSMVALNERCKTIFENSVADQNDRFVHPLYVKLDQAKMEMDQIIDTLLDKSLQTFLKMKVEQTFNVFFASHEKPRQVPASSTITTPISGEARHFKNVLAFERDPEKLVPDAVFKEGRIPANGNCGFSATNTTRKEVVDYLLENSSNESIRKLVAPEITGWLLTGLYRKDTKLPKAILDDLKKYFELEKEKDAVTRQIIDYIEPIIGKRELFGMSGKTVEEIILNWEACRHKLGENLTSISIPEILLDQFNSINPNIILENISNNKTVFETYIKEYYNLEGGYLVLPDFKEGTGVLNVMVEWKGTPVRVWKPCIEKNRPQVYLHYVAGNITEENQDKVLEVIHSGIHFNKLIPIREIPNREVEIGKIEIYSPLSSRDKLS